MTPGGEISADAYCFLSELDEASDIVLFTCFDRVRQFFSKKSTKNRRHVAAAAGLSDL